MRFSIKIFIWLSFFLVLNTGLNAQQFISQLFGEGNGDVVRLMWVPKSWPDNLEGFHVKRRAINDNNFGEWQQLSDALIHPELRLAKNLSNVEKSEQERNRLKAKLSSLVSQGKASELDHNAYFTTVLKSENGLRNMSFAVIVDYDIALLNGFGLIDRNIPEAQSYEYGLFPKFTGEPLIQDPISTYLWEYGSVPDTDIEIESKIRTQGSKRKILASWEVKTELFKAKNLVGFNLYGKNGSNNFNKMNDRLIILSTKNDEEVITHRETIEDLNNTYEFAISPVTMFGTEGSRYEINYDPQNFIGNIDAPRLNHAPETTNGVALNWEFSKESEQNVKGFIIERKAKVGDDYQSVSDLLSVQTRSFEDTPDESGYFFYRLSVVLNDNIQLPGQDLTIYFHHAEIPQGRIQLSAQWVSDDNGYVDLNWSSLDDQGIAGYRIFVNKPTRDLMVYDARIPTITGTSFRYEIGEYMRGEWQFAVVPVSNTNDLGEMSEAVTVMTPNMIVPAVHNRFISQSGDRATISWNYDEGIDDLAGYRIFQNGQIVIDESALDGEASSWTSPPLEAGRRYNFEIMAVTQFGVESERTMVQITIQ